MAQPDKIKRVLLLTDSLALPRDKPEVCGYKKTWPSLLRQEGYTIHQVSIGGATSVDLLRQSHYHQSFNPDVVVIQVGIVDCAPRFISKREKFVLSKVPSGRKVISFLNQPKVRKFRKLTYVKRAVFSESLVTLRNHYSSSVFIAIEIIGGDAYEASLPGIESNITKYNSVLRQIPDSVFLEYRDQGLTMSDHHHLNAKGHRALFEQLNRLVSEAT